MKPPGGAPGWWVVFVREMEEHWIGGKALFLLLCFCLTLAGASFLQTVMSQDDVIPPKEMLFTTLGLGIAFGVLIGLVIAADSLSGERERFTLEGLLLTPVSRRQIVVGKFLAAISPWPVAMAITVPYLAVLAQGDEVLGPTVLWGALFGSLLAAGFAGLGMLTSLWSKVNRTSLFVSLTLYLIFFLPTEMPSGAQKGAMGQLLKRVNPMEAVNQVLEKIVVNNRTPREMLSWMTSPVVFAVLVLGLLFWFADGLSFDGGRFIYGRTSNHG